MITQELLKTENLPDLESWLNDYCKYHKYSCWHHYGPADLDAYHASHPRIMLVNSESYEYEGVTGSPRNEYMKWIAYRIKTPRYGSVLVTAIRQRILQCKGRSSVHFEGEWLRDLYQNDELLLEMMRQTIYMNARITSNDTGATKEETGAVNDNAKIFTKYRQRFIEVMQPEIIIMAGKTARNVIAATGICGNPLPDDPVAKVGKKILIQTGHFARPANFGSYPGLDRIATVCAAVYST